MRLSDISVKTLEGDSINIGFCLTRILASLSL